MLDRYSTLLAWLRRSAARDVLVASAPDKYMFLSISRAVTGIVTVLKWDRILPNAQDYLNLAPLPIRPGVILLANICAIAIAVVVIALTVNGASVVLFPAFVSAASPGSIGFTGFAAAHAISVVLASLFAFCAVFAILGTLAAVLPRETFRAVSSWVRGFLVAAFLALLAYGFAGPLLIQQLERTPGSPFRLLPPMWYLGLYQSLQHRATPELARMAPWAWTGLAAAFGLMAVSYAVSYRRRFAGVLEGPRRPSRQRVLRLALAFLDRFSPAAAGFSRSCYRFTLRTMLRNESQRLCLSISLALGWLLAFQSAWPVLSGEFRPAAAHSELALLAAPLMTAYLLVLGLRVAFEIPAALPANWVFRATLNPLEHEALGPGRRVMLAFVVPAVLAPCLMVSGWMGGAGFALLHTAYVLALSLCLIEIQLSGYRKIPFTCLMPGFRENLPLLCFFQFLGFVAFTRGGAALELWLLVQPWRFLFVPAALAAAWHWNRTRLRDARAAGELEEGLTFDSRPSPAVERLKLFDAE